jgi:hypothetical protein
VRLLDRMVVGSGPCCDLRLHEAGVAHHHALVAVVGGEVAVEPLVPGATWLNGDVLHGRVTVADGDLVSFGEVTFRFVAEMTPAFEAPYSDSPHLTATAPRIEEANDAAEGAPQNAEPSDSVGGAPVSELPLAEVVEIEPLEIEPVLEAPAPPAEPVQVEPRQEAAAEVEPTHVESSPAESAPLSAYRESDAALAERSERVAVDDGSVLEARQPRAAAPAGAGTLYVDDERVTDAMLLEWGVAHQDVEEWVLPDDEIRTGSSAPELPAEAKSHEDGEPPLLTDFDDPDSYKFRFHVTDEARARAPSRVVAAPRPAVEHRPYFAPVVVRQWPAAKRIAIACAAALLVLLPGNAGRDDVRLIGADTAEVGTVERSAALDEGAATTPADTLPADALVAREVPPIGEPPGTSSAFAEAEAQFARGDWLVGGANSAASRYVQVLEQEPSNPVARARLSEIVSRAASDASRAIAAVRFEDARAQLMALESAGALGRMHVLTPEARTQWQVVQLLVAADALLQQRQSQDMAVDNAIDALQKAIQLDPSNQLAAEMLAKAYGLLLTRQRE